MTNVKTTHYIIGTATGPHPFPTIVRDLQSVIGREARAQMLEQAGGLPDVVVACVGGGSNAIGLFAGFLDDAAVRLIGVEAAGSGVDTGCHAATLTAGRPGVLHGTKTFLLQVSRKLPLQVLPLARSLACSRRAAGAVIFQDSNGQIMETHSISAGLDYPGVGPEHSHLKTTGRAQYVPVTDTEALDAIQTLSRCEGIIPALEPAHAIAYVMKLAPTMSKTDVILVNMCGRGDKVSHEF